MRRTEYREAVDDPRLRQHYLGNLPREWAKPYIARMVYHHRLLRVMDRPKSVLCDPSLPSELGLKGYRSNLHVFADAFNPEVHTSEHEFLSTVIDAGGWFACEYHQEPRQIYRDAASDAVDALIGTRVMHMRLAGHAAVARAIRHQLARIDAGDRPVTPAFRERLEHDLRMQQGAVEIAREEIDRRAGAFASRFIDILARVATSAQASDI